MVSRALAVVGVVLGLAVACSPFGVEATRTQAPADGGTDAPFPDATAADGAQADPCPNNGRGPIMVRVANVCIDSTPVTNGQYRAFLADTAKPTFSGAVCGQDSPTDITSPVTDCDIIDEQRTEVFTNPMMPAVCVTVCDARAFCEWAGRHLCGGLDGKPLPDPLAIGPKEDEWTHACTENGAHPLSTGMTWKESGCIVKESDLPSPQPVDREPRCEGPPGVFDMIGNVVSWIDACDAEECRLAGETKLWRAPTSIGLGKSNEPGRCDAIDKEEPYFRATDIGFRCCATPK